MSKSNGRTNRRKGSFHDDAVIDARREEVSRLKVRGFSVREIHSMIEHEDDYNDKRWSLTTIQGDIQFLRQQWRDNAREEIEIMQGEIWAEIREVKKTAWIRGDITTVLKALKQECELLGLDKPLRIARTNAAGEDEPLRLMLGNMDDDQLEALAAIAGFIENDPSVIEISPNGFK
jgi:DNA-binding transcriptional MerR regulator